MKLLYGIRFNRLERQTIERATTHWRLAYPDVDRAGSAAERKQRDRNDSEAREVAALHALARTGAEGNRVMLERAHAALTRLERACEEQSERAYWERELAGSDPLGSAEDARVIESKGVALIAPDTDVIGVLVESRAVQATQARDALEVIQAALRVVPLDLEDDDA
jgi:hypothetical protein